MTHKRRLIHTLRPFARSSLTVGVAIGHHHDHRFHLASGDQVVHDLCGTSQGRPSILITTCTMQQIEHRIATTLLITGRGINGHSALRLQRRAIIPHFGDVAMRHLIDTVEITLVTLLMGHDKDIGIGGNVATHIDIGGIQIVHAIHTELVGIELIRQFLGGIGPETTLLLLQRDVTGLFHFTHRALHFHLRKEITCQLHLHRLGRIEPERYGAIRMNLGRHDVVATK